jgi:hypothetical protein
MLPLEEDYNFTIENMVAHDKPKGWHVDYINGKMTIPQTNFRIGYFINDHYSIALGVDHMKYVMAQNQVANITEYKYWNSIRWSLQSYTNRNN